MFLQRINGSFPMNALRGQFDRTIGDLFDTVTGATPFGARVAFPAINVWEDENSVFAEAEIPGLNMEDIEVLVQRDELTIRGQRRGFNAEGTTYHRRERGTGAFNRVIQLPFEVDSENVQAALRDGVLMITMPKSPAARPRKIKVNG